jgi:ketosteroid isomerase-like protein
MSEEEMATVMRQFIDAVVKGDVEKAASCFQDDATWQTADGTFKGKSEIKRYLTRVNQTVHNNRITETGIRLLVKGNIAVYESDQGGTYKGKEFAVRTICIHEFNGEKFQNVRTIHDRLAIVQQTVSAEGWFARRAVNSIVNTAEKGLH